MITQEKLKESLDYNPTTGKFFWKVKRNGTKGIGSEAGNTSKKGYVFIRLDNKPYLAHRLAWLYTYGEWPTQQIDHKNGQRDDNAIDNLRSVSNRENACNRTQHRNGHLPGVSYHKSEKRKKSWMSRIRIKKDIIFLGYFETEIEAHEAYVTARKHYGV